jgi:ABC-type uncharacterized transport system ATPase subunit
MTATAERSTSAVTPTDSQTSNAIVVTELRKRYGEVQAVDGVSFGVERGEIFALLGPNGAGKTTTLEILEGFRRRDSGRVDVLGFDPDDRTVARTLRERIARPAGHRSRAVPDSPGNGRAQRRLLPDASRR